MFRLKCGRYFTRNSEKNTRVVHKLTPRPFFPTHHMNKFNRINNQIIQNFGRFFIYFDDFKLLLLLLLLLLLNYYQYNYYYYYYYYYIIKKNYYIIIINISIITIIIIIITIIIKLLLLNFYLNFQISSLWHSKGCAIDSLIVHFTKRSSHVFDPMECLSKWKQIQN